MTMFEHGFPVLYALAAWWLGTGVILYLVRLARRTYAGTLIGASVVAGLAFSALAATSGEATVASAYVAFTCSILIWGWQEVAFLTGFATGTRTTPCPAGARGWRRFRYATETLIHHELALVAAGAAVIAVTWGGANQTGTWTFLVLWAMRLSSKLNLFLGVRNLYAELLPAHLSYLASYFTRRPINSLFPVSVTASTVIAVLFWSGATASVATPFEAAGLALVGTLLALAVLEHWFMVLPLPVEALWSWGLSRRGVDRAGKADV
jgi:putative photosynthetic complex assembly protein 2